MPKACRCDCDDQGERRRAARTELGHIGIYALVLTKMAEQARTGPPVDAQTLAWRLDQLAALIVESADLILSESTGRRVTWQ